MPLQVGARFGSYEVLAAIGAGGMGEVYLADDTRLHRKVALKIVRTELAQDHDFTKRFEREARLLASLNHPNIAVLHGLEEVNGAIGLVLEFVEGTTLQQRVRDGRISTRDALELALQIAEALEAAHAQGIIHRDLKPANVKVTPAGVVKVLDFGLAKILAGEPATGDFDHLTTITSAPTVGGGPLGTYPYASPEQLRGEPLGYGTDIWSFGCVLYEMLSGRSAFTGRVAAEITAAVLEREPDWAKLPDGAPPALVRLIQRCLAKDPRERIHHIADVRIELRDLLHTGAAPPRTATRRPWGTPLRIALAGLAGALAGALVARDRPSVHGTATAGRQLVSFAVDLPAGFGLAMDATRELALSHDGSLLVFAASDGTSSRLYLRSIAEESARPIAGTDNAIAPFFSPDDEWVGFFGDGGLNKVRVSGGEPVVICPVNLNLPGLGADWGPDGTIVMGSRFDPLLRVSSAGGESQPIAGLDEAAPEFGQTFPQFLPDGWTVLFVSERGPRDRRIHAMDLRNGGRKIVVEDGDSPRYVDAGYLVFDRAGTLMVVPFDAANTTIQGSPIALRREIASGLPFNIAHYAISRSGSLAYVATADAMPRRPLLRVDRHGNEQPLPVEARGYTACRLSPDGRWIAVASWELQASSIWVSPIDRLALTRLPLTGTVTYPLWHPDASRIVFNSMTGGEREVCSAPTMGAQAQTPISTTPVRGLPTSWSRDGRYLVVEDTPPRSTFAVRLLERPGEEGEREPVTLAEPGFGGTISPDGRWLAFAAPQAGGLEEVFVQQFPGGGRRRQISVRGGQFPVWSRRGDELFYVRSGLFGDTALSEVMFPPPSASPPEFIAVRVGPGPEPTFGEEKVLFSKDLRYGGWGVPYYEVAPDAQSFLVPGPDQGSGSPQIRVILNWTVEFRDRLSQ